MKLFGKNYYAWETGLLLQNYTLEHLISLNSLKTTGIGLFSHLEAIRKRDSEFKTNFTFTNIFEVNQAQEISFGV